MKDHLPLLRETLQFMVQQLRSEDKLCLITFDHEVGEGCLHTKIAFMSKFITLVNDTSGCYFQFASLVWQCY